MKNKRLCDIINNKERDLDKYRYIDKGKLSWSWFFWEKSAWGSEWLCDNIVYSGCENRGHLQVVSNKKALFLRMPLTPKIKLSVKGAMLKSLKQRSNGCQLPL